MTLATDSYNHHGSPSGGEGREPPGTHSECRTGATGSPNESRPRADPGPASGRVSPDPGASTPGTSGLGQSKPPPFRYSFYPPPRGKATPVGLVAVSIKIFQTPHIFKITHIIFGAAVFVFIQIKHKLKPYQNLPDKQGTKQADCGAPRAFIRRAN